FRPGFGRDVTDAIPPQEGIGQARAGPHQELLDSPFPEPPRLSNTVDAARLRRPTASRSQAPAGNSHPCPLRVSALAGPVNRAFPGGPQRSGPRLPRCCDRSDTTAVRLPRGGAPDRGPDVPGLTA